jgi:hypothetical protein
MTGRRTFRLLISSQLQASATFPPGNNPGTFKYEAGWDPRTGLDLVLCRNSISGSPSS